MIRARLDGLVLAVLAQERPAERLGREIDALLAEDLPALAAALLERLVYRIDTQDYWLYYRMWKVYAALGPARQDAAYFAASMAAQMRPAAPASGHIFNALFHLLHRNGRLAEAAELFRHRLIEAPEDPEAQIAAFKHASHLVAPHGAALAHMLLCPPEARVLEISHPLYSKWSYAMQVQAAGIDYTAMVACDAYSDAPEWNDPTLWDDIRPHAARDMRVDLGQLSRYLVTLV